MEHWKNLSLKNLTERVDGIVYTERWKWVLGYGGLYKISSFGRVKSVKRLTTHYAGGFLKKKEMILSQGLDGRGYPQVGLCKDGVRCTKKVHQMVAIAFIKNLGNKPTVNHRRGVKTDNRFHQLEWATIAEQTKHSYDVLKRGLSPTCYKQGRENKKAKQVIQYTLDGEYVATYWGTHEASRITGIYAKSIGSACRGTYLTAGGFKWKYNETL